MDERTMRVRELLHEAAETHHTVFRITGGVDDDWATWYADWLTNLSELPDVLGTRPVLSELVYLLVELDRDYVTSSPKEPWEEYYARELVAHLSKRPPS